MRQIHKHRHCLFVRILTFFIVLSFSLSLVAPQAVYAQEALTLPPVGSMVLPSSEYTPALMLGMTLHPENPLQIDFILDRGDDRLEGEALRAESQKMLSYFYAAMTVPEEDMWVNLSPYEKNRIIAKGLGNTQLGRDMLAEDYILKQLSASMEYPEGEFGKTFWSRVRSEVQAKYGNVDIPMDTFNKIWIVPDTASVYVHGRSVFVVENHLKVMLEEDYLALAHNSGSKSTGDPVTGVTNDIVRKILIPEIEKEVNHGKNFAALRQMFHAIVLATWYKKNLKNSILTKMIANQNKTDGITLKDKEAVGKIYGQYIAAFKKGVYNYIKEEKDPTTQEMVPRKYFSGGVVGKVKVDRAQLSQSRSFLNALRGHALVNLRTAAQLRKEALTTNVQGVLLRDGVLSKLQTAITAAGREAREKGQNTYTVNIHEPGSDPVMVALPAGISELEAFARLKSGWDKKRRGQLVVSDVYAKAGGTVISLDAEMRDRDAAMLKKEEGPSAEILPGPVVKGDGLLPDTYGNIPTLTLNGMKIPLQTVMDVRAYLKSLLAARDKELVFEMVSKARDADFKLTPYAVGQLQGKGYLGPHLGLLPYPAAVIRQSISGENQEEVKLVPFGDAAMLAGKEKNIPQRLFAKMSASLRTKLGMLLTVFRDDGNLKDSLYTLRFSREASIDAKIKSIFIESGIIRVSQLEAKSEEEVLAIKGMAHMFLPAVRDALAQQDKHFAVKKTATANLGGKLLVPAELAKVLREDINHLSKRAAPFRVGITIKKLQGEDITGKDVVLSVKMPAWTGPDEAFSRINSQVGLMTSKDLRITRAYFPKASNIIYVDAEPADTVPSKSAGDRAMKSAEPKNGGIDFDAANLNLTTSGDDLHFNFADTGINPADVSGVRPVILNITPVSNLPMLLGLQQQDDFPKISKL